MVALGEEAVSFVLTADLKGDPLVLISLDTENAFNSTS